ncbi:pentatricopeptide repeat-containing protein At5g39980, chloroplastic [Dendrobium catenatum]|uniref:Pentatricopeptide repeat-containing protein n=1 Tax=Dendrobium catenatum TaxID=906689 RepID=A0A2I0WC30_9ASPA|nr:pentatricopeptide repeat-containing protein At5g39980, chloroplastic [Dendrobium catenatum]PKU73220.1 Pentatricopeptide repeat-containing protein [Dendrobium catenatum]
MWALSLSISPILHTADSQRTPLSPLSGGGTSPRRQTFTLPPIYSTSSGRDVWFNPNLDGCPSRIRTRRPQNSRHGHHQYLNRSVDMDALLAALSSTTTATELHAVMSPYLPPHSSSAHHPPLSPRFMISLLSREPDHRRSLALLDWMHDAAHYPPSAVAYNVVLRNATRAGDFSLAAGLLYEMRGSVSADRYTYSTLLSALSRSNLLDAALSLLPFMDADSISPDLVLFSSLISLALRLGDHSKALALFSRLRAAGITPDLIAYNSLLSALSRAGLFREARRILLSDMDAAGVPPDTISFSTILAALVARSRFLEALSLFHEMRSPQRRLPLDLTTCNIILDAYGQLDMVREADRFFWSMRRLGVPPSVVTCNTMLRVYGDAELFGEAVHLFRLMQRQNMEQNVVTYNTMMKIYGKSLEHEKAGNLLMEMQRRGIEPNPITYSTIISIWARAGKLDRAAKLFQKIRESGVDIDPALYQTMIVVYERAGLVAHARCLLHDLKEPTNKISKDTAVTILAGAGRLEEAAWLFRRAEVKSIEVFHSMMDLFARNKKHANVVEVFDRMRAGGLFPDSEMISMVLNAYGKLQKFEKAEALYSEMEEEGCIFADKVHFQMLSLLGMKRDFKRVEELLEKLRNYSDIDKKELHIVAANLYERANRLDDAARIVGQMNERTSVSNALQVE